MNWLLLSILAGTFSSIHNYFNRYILQGGDDSTSYAWLFETTRLISFIILALFSFYFELSLKTIILLFTLGLLEVVSSFTFMKMHSLSQLSVSTIISRTRLIWVSIIAWIFLGESLKGIEYLGIIVLFLGISVVTSPRNIKMDKGIKLAYVSAIIVAILSVLMKSLTNVASTSAIMIGMSAPSVLLIPILMKDPKKRIAQTLKINFNYKLLAGFSNTFSMFFYTLALKYGQVSKVVAIYQSMMVISVLGGIILLKEKEDIGHKIIGTFIVIVGVILLTYF